MAYPTAADFRTPTLAEYAQGLVLGSDVLDATITAVIARIVDRVEILTNDIFVPTAATYDLRGDGTSRLELPQRCTAVSAVNTRDYIGNLTLQTAASYRLVSSLDAAGATAIRSPADGSDYLEVVPYQYLKGIIGQPWWTWPVGPKTVQVAGTFGWTVTPPPINRAVALMVYDQIKPMNPGLRRASQLQTADAVYTYLPNDPDHPTGIDDADEIIREFRRAAGLMVG